MRESEVRIKPIKSKDFTPITLEIDILSKDDLAAYIKLFDGWDDRIYYKLLKVMSRYSETLETK